MADFARYLPLSQRAAVDETGVSNDWRPFVAERLEHLADTATALVPAWGEPAPGTGWARSAGAAELTTGSIVEGVVARLSTSRSRRLLGAVSDRLGMTDAGLGPAREPGPPEVVAAIAALRSLAAVRRSGVGPHGVVELTDVVAAELALGRGLGLPPRLSGAVALRLTLAAPLAIRASVRDRTLVATDAGWRFGQGAPVEAPAEDLLAFLSGLAPIPG